MGGRGGGLAVDESEGEVPVDPSDMFEGWAGLSKGVESRVFGEHGDAVQGYILLRIRVNP